LVNVSVLSSLSLASIILEYICCSLCICILFLKVEKFANAMIKRPATIAREINGIYVKNESMSFSYCME
jgi:hypothetical protein